MRARPPFLGSLLAAVCLSAALLPPALRAQQSAPVPAVDTSDRQAVLDLYDRYYLPDVNADAGWTGSLAGGRAGTLDDAFLRASLRRINYYRAMAGLRGDVTFDAVLNARCQQAALLCAAEGNISHSPPSTWPCYTADAARACASSNLRLAASGDEGPAAVDGYLADDEAGNYYVGHRRWLLYPAQTVMGLGAVPAGPGHAGTNATWILNLAARPANAPVAVAWPPAGFVPAPLLFRRWSFSYHGADLGAATVRVVKNGVALPVTPEKVEHQFLNGAGMLMGENTLVWELPTNAPAAFEDETYAVTVGNVLVDGASRRISYTVTTVNPASEAAPVHPPMVSITALRPTAYPGGKPGRFLLTRTGDLSRPLSVNFSTGGTALPGAAYPPLVSPAVIPAGRATLKLKVAAFGSGSAVSGQTVVVTLKTPASSRYTVSAPAASATVTVGP